MRGKKMPEMLSQGREGRMSDLLGFSALFLPAPVVETGPPESEGFFIVSLVRAGAGAPRSGVATHYLETI